MLKGGKNILNFPGQDSFIVSRNNKNQNVNFAPDAGTYLPALDPPPVRQQMNEGYVGSGPVNNNNTNPFPVNNVPTPVSDPQLPTSIGVLNMSCAQIADALTKMGDRVQVLNASENKNTRLIQDYLDMITFAEDTARDKGCYVKTNPANNNDPVINSAVVKNNIASIENNNDGTDKKAFPLVPVVIGAAVVVAVIGGSMLFSK